MIAAEVWINHTRPAYARLPRNGLRFRFVMRHVLKTREVTSIFRKAGKVVNVEKRRIYWSFLPHYYIYSTHLRHTLNQILADMLNTSSNRILSADSNRYDISCKLPRDYPREQIGETFVRSVLQELDYELRSVKTQVAGYRLTVSNDSLLNQHAVNPNANSHTNATEVRWGIWTGKGHQFSELIRELESRFNVYIQDGTEINGFFKFQFPIKDFQTATEYLLEKYGLTFVSQDLEIDLRVISSR